MIRRCVLPVFLTCLGACSSLPAEGVWEVTGLSITDNTCTDEVDADPLASPSGFEIADVTADGFRWVADEQIGCSLDADGVFVCDALVVPLGTSPALEADMVSSGTFASRTQGTLELLATIQCPGEACLVGGVPCDVVVEGDTAYAPGAVLVDE